MDGSLFVYLTDSLLQPSATGSNWEKYQKTFADDEVEEKKITPLTDEYEHYLHDEHMTGQLIHN
jgi:hypothetical protein